MKIIDKTTPPDSVKFSDLEVGEVFFDVDIESTCMKIRESVDAEAPIGTYVNNTIDLSDGALYRTEPTDMVRLIRAELTISNW